MRVLIIYLQFHETSINKLLLLGGEITNDEDVYLLKWKKDDYVNEP